MNIFCRNGLFGTWITLPSSSRSTSFLRKNLSSTTFHNGAYATCPHRVNCAFGTLTLTATKSVQMRERIISEIKRVAADSGGKPPGRESFLRETGIKESAWRGRYWARWGDALKEAGFEPNQLEPKTADNFLFLKLAEACRHYGKVPTSAEFRMYRNTDATFPVHSTLDNHFATKAEMIARLREWVASAGGYDDVAAMLPASEAVPKRRMPRATVQDGFVYLLRSGAHYKIGKSDEIERRNTHCVAAGRCRFAPAVSI